MKISLEWLNEYLPEVGAVGAERIAETLMNGGLPVETIERGWGDSVIDVEVTSNRSDCRSHVGVARELGAVLGAPWRGVTTKAADAGGRRGQGAGAGHVPSGSAGSHRLAWGRAWATRGASGDAAYRVGGGMAVASSRAASWWGAELMLQAAGGRSGGEASGGSGFGVQGSGK